MKEIQNKKISSMAEIFINFLSFILLGIVATAVGIIFFQVINKYFPDILSLTYRGYEFSTFNASAIHYSIASLVVGFPLYVWALWFWFRSFRGSKDLEESRLSKWLTYIVLLIASVTVIGDLITVIYNFLSGEFGARFLLKALVILVISVFIFIFYFLERKKIQYKKDVSPTLFTVLLILASLIAVSAVILGFVAGGTPFEARLRKFDLERTRNLQELSSCVSAFAYDNERLPVSLDELKNNARYNYCSRIADPETKKEYGYSVISKNEFNLCGEFNLSNLDEVQGIGYYDNWQRHDVGQNCQKQTVTFGKPLPLEKNAPLQPLPAR